MKTSPSALTSRARDLEGQQDSQEKRQVHSPVRAEVHKTRWPGRWREKGSLENRMLRKDKRPLGEQAEVSFVTRSVR